MAVKKQRLMRGICAGIIVALLMSSLHAAEKNKNKAKPKPEFEIRNIEGWIVYINKKDLAEHKEQMDEALDHLQNQLYQTVRVLPQPAVTKTQELVPIWIEFDTLGTAYHPQSKWLTDRGHQPPGGLGSMAGFCKAKSFCRNALHQPWVVLHELSHGYDYQFLGGGRHYSNEVIDKAYRRAKRSGTYESVLCRYSPDTKHYAMNNKMEYLAENTEAYFGTNDFYPFVRAELREHDPHACRLLENMWGVDVEKEKQKMDSLANFIEMKSHGAVFGDSNSHPASARGDGTYIPTSRYKQRQIEGWTVYINPLLEERIALSKESLKLLRHKLHMVKRYVPEKALKPLQKVAIWVELENPNTPHMTYHCCKKLLKSQHQNPDKLGAVEIGNVANFMQWSFLQPFMVLNRLARAYHDKVLGYDNAEIKTAHQQAAKSEKYDLVLRFDGQYVRHPALTDPKEYFAEMSEAYYGVNDHYPFIQFELKQFDPNACELMTKLWQGKAK
ncbi:MAG: hypothetical protein ACYS32_05390 [Planctomycetota bacterium]